MSTTSRVWFHRSRAVAWVVVGVLSFVFGWQDSVVLVWLASLYANVSTDWGNGEAADDHLVTDRLDRIEKLLTGRGIAPMPAIQYHFEVEMEDGTELTVTADQRDVSAWESEPFGTSASQMTERLYTSMRYLAWNALRRKGLIDKKLTWTKFSDECVEVRDKQPEESATDVDPTQSGQPTTS